MGRDPVAPNARRRRKRREARGIHKEKAHALPSLETVDAANREVLRVARRWYGASGDRNSICEAAYVNYFVSTSASVRTRSAEGKGVSRLSDVGERTSRREFSKT